MNWKLFALAAAFFLFIVVYVLEIAPINRYLQLKTFWLVALGVGIVLAVLLIVSNRRRLPPAGLDRTRIIVGVVAGCIVLTPLLLSLTNRLFSSRQPDTISVEFVSETGRYGSRGLIEGQQYEPTFYELFFYWEHRLYRVAYQASHYDGTTSGSLLQLPVRRGLWGFDWVNLK